MAKIPYEAATSVVDTGVDIVFASGSDNDNAFFDPWGYIT